MKLILRYWWLIAIVLILLKSKKILKKDTIVKYGEQSDNVRKLQEYLYPGHPYIEIDGIYGQQTATVAIAHIFDIEEAEGVIYEDKYYHLTPTNEGEWINLDWLLSHVY